MRFLFSVPLRASELRLASARESKQSDNHQGRGGIARGLGRGIRCALDGGFQKNHSGSFG